MSLTIASRLTQRSIMVTSEALLVECSIWFVVFATFVYVYLNKNSRVCGRNLQSSGLSVFLRSLRMSS
jgi:hypothetical protein